MGSTWVLSAPDRPHIGPMSLAIRGTLHISRTVLLKEHILTTVLFHCRIAYNIALHWYIEMQYIESLEHYLPWYSNGVFISHWMEFYDNVASKSGSHRSINSHKSLAQVQLSCRKRYWRHRRCEYVHTKWYTYQLVALYTTRRIYYLAGAVYMLQLQNALTVLSPIHVYYVTLCYT